MVEEKAKKRSILLLKLLFLPFLLLILFGGLLFWANIFNMVEDRLTEMIDEEKNKVEVENIMTFNVITPDKSRDNNSLSGRVFLTKFSPEISDVYRLEKPKEHQNDETNRIDKYISAIAIDRNNHDYFNFTASKSDYKDGGDSGGWNLGFSSASIFGDEVLNATTWYGGFKFSKIDLEKCGISSFLAKSGIMFLFCLNSFNKETSEANVDAFVFSQNKPAYDTTLSLVFSGKIVLSGKYGGIKESKEEFFEREIKVASIDRNKFYILTNKEIFVLDAEDEKFKMSTIIPFDAYSVLHKDNSAHFEKSSLATLWYVNFNISPSGKYIYFVSSGGGIIDTTQDKILSTDNSCVKLTNYPKDQSVDSYKNDYIDPFTEAQYKGVGVDSWDEKNGSFVSSQGFSSGGGVCEDGKIYTYMGKDQVTCKIVANLKCKSTL